MTQQKEGRATRDGAPDLEKPPNELLLAVAKVAESAQKRNVFASDERYDVDCAYALLVIVSALRRRGLVEPDISLREFVQGCESLLARGCRCGVHPPDATVAYLVAHYVAPILPAPNLTPMFPALEGLRSA